MNALLVGADKLGNIPSTLENHGISNYIHWTGRKKGMRKLDIPEKIDMIIVFYDFIEHNITEIIKQKAKQNNIPCVFSKRACSDLSKRLENCKDCKICLMTKN
ncbi:DUF2325 domain-containing protein [Alkaliphilus hydrothermalis]|uniref:Dihydroorotate dehydrogenase n=1 Tax=Alkaliphilus hydrothermalis TaxID=1482730 RepID=A0ABS2NLW5_9FIRM|nr:DUF2325 domain-containing protein [Alkaliphilus hydrothermalis]MBM7613902.1 hypothetical protein [Alkaliphilus hydrothermalis]